MAAWQRNIHSMCKMHSQSPILKTKSAQQPRILTQLWTKLPTYCNLEPKIALQCLKNMGLQSSLGGSRFSFWQSWLTRASRIANLQASALNAGVPTAWQRNIHSMCQNVLRINPHDWKGVLSIYHITLHFAFPTKKNLNKKGSGIKVNILKWKAFFNFNQHLRETCKIQVPTKMFGYFIPDLPKECRSVGKFMSCWRYVVKYFTGKSWCFFLSIHICTPVKLPLTSVH